MSSLINASTAAAYNAQSAAGTNWLKDTFTAIQNSANQGGLLGMLQNAGGDGSIGSFLGQSSAMANNLALISTNSVTSASSFVAQIASQNQKTQDAQKLQDALDALTASQNMIKPQNTLDPFIYFSDGTSIDTNNNIMTKPDGTQYDTLTGAKYVDPASIIQMANGAYLNTQTNIMTLADGTQIDTVTGLKV